MALLIAFWKLKKEARPERLARDASVRIPWSSAASSRVHWGRFSHVARVSVIVFRLSAGSENFKSLELNSQPTTRLKWPWTDSNLSQDIGSGIRPSG